MNSQEASKSHASPTSKQQGLLNEIAVHLVGLSEADISKLFSLTMWLVNKYASGYELDGPLFLVLDNTIIQDYKHQKTNSGRAIRALAYTTFCRFIRGWSDRQTSLAVTAVAIYEHIGRKIVASPTEALSALSEIRHLLIDTDMSVATLGFNSPEELESTLHKVHSDSEFLTQYVREIDAANWQLDLRAPMGVKIPMGIAHDAIPDDLPLRYFDPLYVKFVFSSRIELLIIRQSSQNPEAMPISSGEMMEALANLNEINRRELLTGLGDIDLLQVCDISRQYKQNPKYVLLGQTFDKGLAEVLRHRHVYYESTGVRYGSPKANEEISEMVNLMFSNPFVAQDVRRAAIRPKVLDFFEAFASLCQSAVTK